MRQVMLTTTFGDGDTALAKHPSLDDVAQVPRTR